MARGCPTDSSDYCWDGLGVYWDLGRPVWHPVWSLFLPSLHDGGHSPICWWIIMDWKHIWWWKWVYENECRIQARENSLNIKTWNKYDSTRYANRTWDSSVAKEKNLLLLLLPNPKIQLTATLHRKNYTTCCKFNTIQLYLSPVGEICLL